MKVPIAILVAVTSVPLFAQLQPVLVVTPEASWILPRNTQVVLSLTESLSTKSKRQKEGDTFSLTVSKNVMFKGYVVIPRGSRAVGHIAWQTRKGAFGKSGKMELAFDYVEVGDTRIPLTGKHREVGEGNGDATMVTFVFLSMLGSGLITGHSAEIPAGKEFVTWTAEDTPVFGPTGETPQTALGATAVSPGLAAIPVPVKKASPPPSPPQFGNSKVRCSTCRN